MKVYAVYSIPRSPEYKLEKLFLTKENAKEYVKNKKNPKKMIFIPCVPCGEKLVNLIKDDLDDLTHLLHHYQSCDCICHKNMKYILKDIKYSIENAGKKIYDIQIEEIEE